MELHSGHHDPIALINYLIYPIAQAGGYHAVKLKRGRELVAGIPNKVDDWHQEWWWMDGAWQTMDPTSPLTIVVLTKIPSPISL